MMLRCAIYVSLVGALAAGNPNVEEPVKDAIALTLPELEWALEIRGADLTVERKAVTPDRMNASFMAVDWATGILVSGFLEDRGRPATAEQCRDFYWTKLKETPPKEEDVKQSKFGNLAIMECVVKEYAGRKMNHKHVNAYLTKGNFWMDIHLSKMDFKESEREMFDSVLRNVRLVPRKATQKMRASYRITNQMVLRLDIPPRWLDEIKPGSGDTPPEIRMTPRPDGSSLVLVRVLSLKEDMPDDERLIGIREMVENAGREALPQAIERTFEIRQFKGRSSSGCLFTLTDKAPKPNEFKYLTQGGYGVGRLILLFTILSNEKDPEVSRLALEMVGNAQAVTDRPRKMPDR